ITAKWCKVNYRGIEGWAFGGYLDLGRAVSILKEESDVRSYIGKSFADLDPALKKYRKIESSFGGDMAITGFSYPGYYVVLLEKKAGMEGNSAVWKITDAMKLVYIDKRERVFFPGLCSAPGIKDPIFAVAAEPGADCVYTQISRAWTLDRETFHFSPAMTDEIKCRPECCGDNACD
ncbi:MAG: hypothetical protein ACRCUT_02245, partial [Spirochaetota bacterium]